MPRKSGKDAFTPKNIAVLALVLGAIGVGTYFVGNYLGLWSVAQVPTSGFSVTIVDGMSGKSLPTDEFDYTLWGTDNLQDWGEFEEIQTDADPADIGASDIVDYQFFVIRYNATVDHDDDLFDDDTGARTYYNRWAVLDDSGPNVLIAYQQPSDTDFLLISDETFQIIAAFADINEQTNFTIVAAINYSQLYDAKWVAGNNYENEDADYLELRITFNVTMALSDVTISGTTKHRISDTMIGFRFTELSAIPSIFHAVWDDDAPDCVMSDYDLYFGDTILANH